MAMIKRSCPVFGAGFGLVGVVRVVSIGRFVVSGARDQGVL